MAVVLDETTRELLDGKNFATVATVNPDGGPQTSVVWILRDGDTVLWYWATFDANGNGPNTLALRRKGNCYRVFAQDGSGSELHAPGAVLRFDGKTRKASFTGTCIGRHHSLVYATSPGTVRSNALA